MIAGLLQEPSLPICWTKMWRNSYSRLFKEHKAETQPITSPAGPDSLDSNEEGILGVVPNGQNTSSLTFKFSPEMGHLINPQISSLPAGSDAWAIAKGWVSVTPMRACFAEPGQHIDIELLEANIEQSIWKVKL